MRSSPFKYLIISIGLVAIISISTLYLYPARQTRERSTTSSQARISLVIGPPKFNNLSFSYNTGSTKFIGSEEFPVTVQSTSKTDLDLKSLDVPKGVWLAIIPSHLSNVDSAGANATIVIAGAVKPLVPTSHYEIVIIQAISRDGYVEQTSLPVRHFYNLTILKSVGPLGFLNRWEMNENGSTFQVFGAVYDPAEGSSSAPLPVRLKVAGLLQNGSIEALPPWLQVSIPISNFSLNALRPFYFILGAITSSAPVGKYTLVVEETIGNQKFMAEVQFGVFPPIKLE